MNYEGNSDSDSIFYVTIKSSAKKGDIIDEVKRTLKKALQKNYDKTFRERIRQ